MGIRECVSQAPQPSLVGAYGCDTFEIQTILTQDGQTRSFEYSTMGRLTKACNPESGTAACTVNPLPDSGLEKYTYDPGGNPLTKTDALGFVTTYGGYDHLNRPQSVTYTKSDGSAQGTPNVTYVYDQDWKGALSSTSAISGGNVFGSTYTHDALGRIHSSTQTTAGTAYQFVYQYSLADRLEQVQYPSGRLVNYGADSAGRIQSVKNGATQANYATIAYNSAGGLSSIAMGNGITEQYGWNDRSQLTSITAGSALTLNYYQCTGQAAKCSSGNNGNLQAQKIVAPGWSVTQTYGYDAGNRLTSAQESGSAPWKETYRYDNAAGQRQSKMCLRSRSGTRVILRSQNSALGGRNALNNPSGYAW